MSQDFRRTARTSLNAVSKVSFAVAITAFATALLGLLINQIFTGWMAAGGMAGVGLFYLAIGVLNLEWSSSSTPRDEKETDEEESDAVTYYRPSASDANHLTGERVGRTPHADHKHAREQELVSTRG